MSLYKFDVRCNQCRELLESKLRKYLEIVPSWESPKCRAGCGQGFSEVDSHPILSSTESRREQREHSKEDGFSSMGLAIYSEAEDVVIVGGRLLRGELESKLLPLLSDSLASNGRRVHSSLLRLEGNGDRSGRRIRRRVKGAFVGPSSLNLDA